jgi:hypothetical protein
LYLETGYRFSAMALIDRSLRPIQLIPLNSFQKTQLFPFKETKMLKSIHDRNINKDNNTGWLLIGSLLLHKKYESAFRYARSFCEYFAEKMYASKMTYYIGRAIDNVLTDVDNDTVLGIRRLNPWLKELILYFIWISKGNALRMLGCKLDFPSIEFLLKLQVKLCPRNKDEEIQFEKVKNILEERQNQLLNVTDLNQDIIKLICQY